MEMIELITNAIQTKKFGTTGSSKSEPLFMEPRHYKSATDFATYTIKNAVSEINPQLTSVELSILHKLQFEIYKPSMANYMRLINDSTVYTVDAENLNTEYLRTNFESNIVIPLQPWSGQNYLLPEHQAILAQERQIYIKGIAAILNRINTDPQYKFIIDHDHFYYLCSYLERSTHKSKPVIEVGPEADRQKAALESLVYELRALVVTFINNTNADKILLESMRTNTCANILKSDKD
jgi:hypothetical protein